MPKLVKNPNFGNFLQFRSHIPNYFSQFISKLCKVALKKVQFFFGLPREAQSAVFNKKGETIEKKNCVMSTMHLRSRRAWVASGTFIADFSNLLKSRDESSSTSSSRHQVERVPSEHSQTRILIECRRCRYEKSLGNAMRRSHRHTFTHSFWYIYRCIYIYTSHTDAASRFNYELSR